MHAITIISGGMDSATLAYHVNSFKNCTQHFLSFNYGQKHGKELECAKKIAATLKGQHDVIDLTSITHLLKGSALTDSVSMPEGYYAEETMRLTVVPNRNAIMLSIAWATGIAEKAAYVFYGAHAGDHFIYEDCRPEFVEKLSSAFSKGTHGPFPYDIRAPFLHHDKAQILREGIKLKVPYEDTWTCYQGGEVSCGKCGSCQERLWAFSENGIEDPLPYATRKLIKKGEQVG